MERKMRATYYWLQAIFAALLTAWMLGFEVRLIINHASLIYLICVGVMTIAAAKLILATSVSELLAFRKEKKGATQERATLPPESGEA